MSDATRICRGCGKPFGRKGVGAGRWPKYCDPCRGEQGEEPAKERTIPGVAIAFPSAADIVEVFALDHLVGLAVVALLEYRAGDEAGNLRAARHYITRALEARMVSAA
jgi:hypothetical protein